MDADRLERAERLLDLGERFVGADSSSVFLADWCAPHKADILPTVKYVPWPIWMSA
jgi:hypothetical protein